MYGKRMAGESFFDEHGDGRVTSEDVYDQLLFSSRQSRPDFMHPTSLLPCNESDDDQW